MLASFLISAVYAALCVLLFCHIEQHTEYRIPKTFLLLAVIAAVGIRVFFGLQDYYFTYDMNCFKAWGGYAHELGFKNLYSGDFFLDYPPGYMYVLYALDCISDLLGLGYNDILCSFIYKLPAIIADFGCGWLIYLFAKEKLGESQSCFLSLAFLFAPNIIFNSSVWGQIESWYLFFLGFALYFAYHNRTVFAAVAYAAALITKPQSLLFGPVLLFWIVKRKSLKELVKALGTGFAAFYVMALPFCKNLFDVMWLIDLYKGTFQGYEHFTINGFNLYYLLGLNWTELSGVQGSGQINFAVIGCVLGLVAFFVLCARGNSGFFAAAAVSISVVFAFCTMMHERYIYPAVLMCVLSYIARDKKPYLLFAVLISCINYINSSWVMAMYYQTFDLNSTAEKAVSLCAVAVTVGLAIYAIYDVFTESGLSVMKFKKPVFILTFITAVYALFALNMLGADYAPQTFYQSTEEDFSFRVHFEQPVQLGSIYVYSGLGDENAEPVGRKVCGDFEVFTSTDGENFEHLWNIEGQSVYTWKEYHADVTASTVLVQAKHAGSVLGEIIFCDSEDNTITGTLDRIESDNPYSAVYALDESSTKPFDTGYYNSMYFDEIYHGRTAYEQLQGYSIYETTHPPLGKILISLGIKLFGMTPFGWRIVGAVCGIAMIPLVYLLCLALTKNSWCGLVAAALTACDFMHFTQTRIATVDTYVVLFMLMTFLFMAYWHRTDFGDKKEWLYLLLSGSFMGCCVASKWNGAYPMVGLALFFFIRLFGKYRSSKMDAQARSYAVKTILMCFVFFVAVPVLIYCASFIPVIHADGFGDYINQLWEYQKHMFDYHANLEAEHFFSSMWYTWPFSIKPIWYAVSETGNMVSTISAFGNPLIWLLTPFAAVYCLVCGIKDKATGHLFVALGYLASYLPWVMVSRLCFIYHYFPCAVFGITAMAIAAADLVHRLPKSKKAVWIYIGICAAMFLIFLPVTSGISAPKGYIEALEIMPQWYFVN